MEESEKQILRDLKSEVIKHLRSLDIYTYNLDSADSRLNEYVISCLLDPEGHNLYELLAIKRFFYLLDKYEFRENEVKRFVSYYERLKFTGVKGPTRYKLTPIQTFQFSNILGFYRSDGRRLIREALLFVPRKYSKTSSVASLAVYDLLYGDANAQAYVGANSYDQAQICFGEIKNILKSLDPKFRHFKINREIAFNRRKGKSSFARCVATNPDNLDGKNASTVIMDEYSQAKNAELKTVLTTSMGVRENPLTIIITTASDKIDTPFFEMLGAYKKILRGELGNDNIFASIFEPDVDDEEGDPRTWKKVNPHIGVTVKEDFYQIEYEKAQLTSDDMLAFRNKMLNIFAVNEKKAWISRSLADSFMSDFSIDNVLGRPPCLVSIDLSVSDDFSAVCYLLYIRELNAFRAQVDYYIPEDTIENHPNKELYRCWVDSGYLKVVPGNVISYSMIVEDILRRAKVVDIKQIGYDSYKSKECVNMLAASGAQNILKAVSQTQGNFTSPVESFEYVAKLGRFKTNHNPITAYCFGNAVLDTDKNGNKKPFKISENKKIDGVITILMCFRLSIDYEQR